MKTKTKTKTNAPYPIIKPRVEVFNEHRLKNIYNLEAYKKAVPEVRRNSPAAKNLSKQLSSVDELIATHFGIDGLPILIKYKKTYFVVSGQLTLAAAKIMHCPVVCIVYNHEKFLKILDEIAYVAAYVKPFAVAQYVAVHQSAPHTSSGKSSDLWMPYHHAAAIDAYNNLDTPLTRVMPKNLFATLNSLELLGIGSKSGLQRKNIKLDFTKNQSLKPKGQFAHPDLVFER